LQKHLCKEFFAIYPHPVTSHSAENVVLLDASTLKALAHPLRVRILGVLRLHGAATATTLAQRIGVNTGATSYHLRQLADAGLVVEDTGRGNAKDRWWQAAHTTSRFDLAHVDEADGLAYLTAVADAYGATMRRAVEELPSLPEEWRDAATLSDYSLSLTAAEARQLVADLEAVVAGYRSVYSAEAAPEDARRFSVQLQAFRTPGMPDEAP
jgi:DNA-binding transcriptional ArsR family regulator